MWRYGNVKALLIATQWDNGIIFAYLLLRFNYLAMPENTTVETSPRVLTVRVLRELLATLPLEADNLPVAHWSEGDVVYISEITPAEIVRNTIPVSQEKVIMLH